MKNRMAFLAAGLFVMVLATAAATKTPLETFRERDSAYRSVQNEVTELDARIESNNSYQRRDLMIEREEVFGRLQKSAIATADALENLSPLQGGSEGTLLRWYQIAKLRTVAGQCHEASSYFGKIRKHSMFDRYKMQGKQLSSRVDTFVKDCEKQGAGVRIDRTSYNGKAAYVLEERRDLLIDSRPYTATELETFGDRVYELGEVAAAVEAIGVLSDSGTVLSKPPFLLVDGPGDYKEQSLRPKKIVPDEFGDSVGALSRLTFLENLYKDLVKPVAANLQQNYFNRAQPGRLIPLYLVGGNLDEDGLMDYVGFCHKVHFRSCGLRVGYFEPYDNSVMVWLATGGGTLSHELGHALMEADFPAAPDWLSEGLASLHEQLGPGFKPLDNYRLYYLKASLKYNGRLIPLERLLTTPFSKLGSPEEVKLFAAHSRYLSLYLWEKKNPEKNLLADVYEGIRSLPEITFETQAQVLSRHLGMLMDEIERDWEEWLRRRQEPDYWTALRPGIYDEVSRLRN